MTKKKVIFILLICMLGFFSLQAQQKISKEAFYYYQGEKIFLKERTDKIFLKLVQHADKSSLLSSIRSNNSVRLSTDLQQGEALTDMVVLEAVANDISAATLEQYKANPNIVSALPVLQYNETLQGLADEFVVKLKENTSYLQLQQLASNYRCTIIEENQFVQNQFLLSVAKESALNAMQLSNLFYETELFEFSEPNFIILNAFNSSDAYFSQQWGLKNTGLYGGTAAVDIKIEQAWAITQASANKMASEALRWHAYIQRQKLY